MTGYAGTSKTKIVHHYYKCNNAKKKLCDKKAVKKEKIEELVLSECRKILTDFNIAKIAKEVMAILNASQENSELIILKKRLKDYEKQKIRLMEAIKECDDSNIRKDLFKEIPKVNDLIGDTEKQIAIEESNTLDISETQIEFFLTQLKHGDVNDIKYRRMLIKVLVNQIYLFDDHLTIIFNTSSKPVEITVNLIEEIEENNDNIKSSLLSTIAPPCDYTSKKA